MPRGSGNRNIGDEIEASRLQQINSDLDDLYSQGSDRGRVWQSTLGALKIDIGAFTYRVGSTIGQYVGATGISLTNNITNYIEIDNTGTIQINTTGWIGTNARIASVVTLGGVISSISNQRNDVLGGNLAGSSLSRSEITSRTQNIAPNNGYIANAPIFTTSTRARNGSNISTIVTSASHGLTTGDIVSVSNMGDDTYNANNVSVTVINSTTFSYSNTGSTETTIADTGGTISICLLFTLPSSPVIGDVYKISGKGIGGYRIRQNSSQQIVWGNIKTTTGTSGFFQSSVYDQSISIIYIGNNIFSTESQYFNYDNNGSSYSNIVFFIPLTSYTGTNFTITHNLGIIEQDVVNGRYEVMFCGYDSGRSTTFSMLRQAGGSSAANSYAQTHFRTSADSTGISIFNRQKNTLKLNNGGSTDVSVIIIKKNR